MISTPSSTSNMHDISPNIQAHSEPPKLLAPAKGGSRKQILLAGILAFTIGGAIIGACALSGRHANAAAAAKVVKVPVLTVRTICPQRQPIAHQIAVHGTISAWDPVSVGATAAGLEVQKILVEEGDIVKQGQILAILDSAQLRAQLDSEKARLASSIANVSKSIQPNRPEDINQLIAAVAQQQAQEQDAEASLIEAKANLDNARTNIKRYQYLRAEGAVSAQEAETRETTAQVNEAALRSAEERVRAQKFALRQVQERLAMAKIGGRREDIQIANASVAEIQGNVRRLQTQIDQTIIKAPVDGLITRRDAHLGDISTVGKSMFMMSRDNRLELKAEVPEQDLTFVQAKQSVTLHSAINPQATIRGWVREISPLVDATTRLATVRIDLPNRGGFRAGMYAEGQIDVGEHQALTLPAKSVICHDEKASVFVLHHDTVESRPVEIGTRDGKVVEIKSGIKPDDSVVTEGAGFLKDGDCVSVSKTEG